MHNPFELPLFIPVRPSPWFIALFYMAHLGAITVLFASNISLLVQLLITSGLVASLCHGHFMYINQGNPDSPVQLVLNQTGEWLLNFANGRTLPAVLKPAAFVHPLLVVLSFKADTGICRVVLTPDTVDPDTFRRLRVRLRFRNSNE